MPTNDDATDRGAPLRVSVVIPTLNEASHLPCLLDRLDAQTRRPDEIVVADGASRDGTADIARTRGLRVVAGGMPAVGRNAGATATSGDVILFMDADAEPEPDFLERALDEFNARDLSCATAPMRAALGEEQHRFWIYFSEGYIRALQHVSPHAVGLCILVRRDLHEAIGGFDETLVLAEDHDYARRAARHGRFGVLRSVKVRTSMRRVREQGRARLTRVLVYSELHTLAGRPIRQLPFPYSFGAFEAAALAAEGGGAGGAGGGGGGGNGNGAHEKRNRAREAVHALSKPSSEIQGDAIGVQLASVLAGGLGSVALASTGAGPASYLLPMAGVAAVAGASTYEALRKLRYERSYGEYFSSSVAVASDDIIDATGRVIVRAGVDEICELHAIGHLGKMARLSREGLSGRLQVIVDTLEGLRSAAADMDDPFYQGVTYITARSDLTALLFKMGFSEVMDPPKFDFINRAEKRVLMWVIGLRTGRKRDGDAEKYRMAIMSKAAFAGPEFRSALDAQIARARRDLERARAFEARHSA